MKTQVWVQRSKRKELSKQYFQTPTGAVYSLIKPLGGLWTSTWDETTGGDWVRWCLSENFEGPKFHLWLAYPDPLARIYTIDSHQDLKELYESYPRCDKYDIDWAAMGIDWAAMGEDWDGVHLTEEGQAQTRFAVPLSLYGWDCECTLWFHWRFMRVEDIGVKHF